MKMKRIGITGGVGSGKSSVLAYLETKPGIFVCQADKIAWELQQPGQVCYTKIRQYFGPSVIATDGKIDREKLGKIVFQESEKLFKLNQIVHPLVNEKIEVLIREQEKMGTQVFFLEAALLTDPFYQKILDEIWFVYAEEEERRERLRRTRNYTEEKISGIMHSQATEEEFRSVCKEEIENSGTFEHTKEQLDRLLEKVSKKQG